MVEKAKLQKFVVRLIEDAPAKCESVVDKQQSLRSYDLKTSLPFKGKLFVVPPNPDKPPWWKFVESGTIETLDEILNSSSAAVLLVQVTGAMLAYTFGQGRYLLQQDKIVSDFGIKTALNALRHDSLRSLDSFSFEGQTIHRRTQASKASKVDVFGVDLHRDILRAVTGAPLPETGLTSVSGSESTLAISIPIAFSELGELSEKLLKLYREKGYKKHFAWVDNVRRVRATRQMRKCFLKDRVL